MYLLLWHVSPPPPSPFKEKGWGRRIEEHEKIIIYLHISHPSPILCSLDLVDRLDLYNLEALLCPK